jgi:hypothetical protein
LEHPLALEQALVVLVLLHDVLLLAGCCCSLRSPSSSKAPHPLILLGQLVTVNHRISSRTVALVLFRQHWQQNRQNIT